MVRQKLALAWHRLPFLKIFFVYALGITAGYYLPMGSLLYSGLWMLTGLCLCGIALLSFSAKRLKRWLLPMLWNILLGMLGLLAVKQHLPAHDQLHFKQYSSSFLAGIIVEDPVVGERTIRFPVEVKWALEADTVFLNRGRLLLHVLSGPGLSDYRYGDFIIFEKISSELPVPWNPKQFDYKAYLAKKGIYEQSFLQQDQVWITERGRGFFLIQQALRIRDYLRVKFASYLSEGLSFQICSALIFGYRGALDTAVRDTFGRTGTVHVLAVSGLHVGLLFYMLNRVLKFLDGIRYGKTLRLGLVLFFIWAYVFLTGMAPSILRAGIMISFFCIAEFIGRKQNNLNTLFAAAFFMVLVQPNSLFELGFQLSYSAVLGIFTLYPLLKHAVHIRHPLLRRVIHYVFVSIAAQLFTAPWVLYYFQQFPNLFLIGNLFIAIPVVLIMYTGLAFALSPVDYVNVFLGRFLDVCVQLTFAGLKKIEGLPYALTAGVDFDGKQLFLGFLCLFLLTMAWQLRNKRLLLYFLLGFLLLSAYSSYKAYRLASFRGYKLYNTEQHLSLGLFEKGRLTLYSSLDSLAHPSLKSRVWADLQRYGSLDNVVFVKLSAAAKENYSLTVFDRQILILHQAAALEDLPRFDLLIWRTKQVLDRGYLPVNGAAALLVFDATQSASNLLKSRYLADSLGQGYYVLKDNFAYVWDSKEHGE